MQASETSISKCIRALSFGFDGLPRAVRVRRYLAEDVGTGIKQRVTNDEISTTSRTACAEVT